MAAQVHHETGIQWTHVPGYIGASWNPTTGCSRVSPGCNNCYAFQLHDQRHIANRNSARSHGLTTAAVAREMGYKLPVAAQYDVPFSRVQLLDERRLEEPLRARKPRAYFVDSMADLFHENVPDGFIWQVWDVMRRCPQHQFMILTKRPDRMRDFVTRWCDLSYESPEPQLVRGPAETRKHHPSGRGQLFAAYLDHIGEPHGGVPPKGAAWPTFDWMEGPRWAYWWPPNRPLPNVWLGVSVEDQKRADERIPLLLDTPAAVRFLSCEPLLGPVHLEGLLAGETPEGIDWVIAGGESGAHSRPMDLADVRSLRDQCRAAGVAFFYKQGGTSHRCSHSGHGGHLECFPADLRIREWPDAR